MRTVVALSPTPLAAVRYWNVARQRYTRRLARNGKPCASLATQPPSQPRTPARKAGVLDARKWLQERDGLSAGASRIRTLGPTLSLGPATWVELGASGSARQSDRCWDGANPWVSLPSMCRFVSNSPRLSTLLTTRHRTAAIRRSSIAAALKKPVVIAYYCFGNVNHFQRWDQDRTAGQITSCLFFCLW